MEGIKHMLKIKPVRDNLYIEVLQRPTEMRGIVMPEKYRYRTEKAIIRAIGPEVKGDYKVGQFFILQFYSGIHIQLEETYSQEPLHRIINESEILAILPNEKG